MDKKTLSIILILIAVALGAWWFSNRDSGQRAQENLLAGAVTSIDRANQSFQLNVLEEVNVGESTDIRDVNYTVKWDNNTQFYIYRSSADVDTKQAAHTQAGELSRESSIDVQTKENSGNQRTAQIIWIYPSASQTPQATSEGEILEE